MEKKIKKSILLFVVFMVASTFLVCQRQYKSPTFTESDLSSPKRTFQILEGTAKGNDSKNFARCIYFVPKLRKMGYDAVQAIALQESVSVLFTKSEYKVLKFWLMESFMLFQDYNFEVLGEFEIDSITKELLVRSIPRRRSNLDECLSKYYFSKHKDKWLYNLKRIDVEWKNK